MKILGIDPGLSGAIAILEKKKVLNLFDMPVMADRLPAPQTIPDKRIFEAVETLLWRWKTPLAREWYPFLFGLKHDLLIADGALPELRIAKTQSAPLYHYLTGHHRDDEGKTYDDS